MAKELGLEDYFAEVLPEQKADKEKEVQSRGLVTAMRGDGVQRCRNPFGGGVLYTYEILLSPAMGTVLMSLSTVIVAINARLLKVPEAVESEA